jgi:transposase
MLLPDREQATAATWLRERPTIGIVARDQGGGYGEAIARALPHATQVADRWHLMENASRAFLDAVRRSMRQVRGVVGAATVNPDLLTAAERLQYEGYLRREETNAAVRALVEAGVPIKQISRRVGHSEVVRGGGGRGTSVEHSPVTDQWLSSVGVLARAKTVLVNRLRSCSSPVRARSSCGPEA